MVHWEPQSKTTPQSLEDERQTHLLYITYSYCILSRAWKLATWLLVLCHCEHLFLFSMLILHVTLSRFCLYLLNILYYTFSHALTEARTHKHTRIISIQERWLLFLFFFFFLFWSSLKGMPVWVKMGVLWGRCKILCRMYVRGKEVVREWLWQPGQSRAPRLVFQTLRFKRDIQYVIPSVNVITFSEREEELPAAEFTKIYSPRSLSPLIDMDKCGLTPPPVSPERVLVCLPCVWSPCVYRAFYLNHSWGYNLRLQLLDSAWSYKVHVCGVVSELQMWCLGVRSGVRSWV